MTKKIPFLPPLLGQKNFWPSGSELGLFVMDTATAAGEKYSTRKKQDQPQACNIFFTLAHTNAQAKPEKKENCPQL